MGPRIREDTGGDGLPFSSSRGQAVSGGTGMGPRIREDNGRGRFPVCVFTGASCERGDGDGDGPPHPRGEREEEDFCGNEIPRLRCAALGMTCCQGE